MTLPEPNVPTADEENGGAPLALKLLVYGMGVMLLLGMFLFAGALWWKFGRQQATADAPVPVRAALPTATESFGSFETRDLPLPEGTRVLETVLDGTRLMLRLERVETGRPSPGGRVEMLWLYDLADGRVIGTYYLTSGR